MLQVASLIPDCEKCCLRCGGFMMPLAFRDYDVDLVWYTAQRCVNCGYIWDPVIGRHQHRHLSGRKEN